VVERVLLVVEHERVQAEQAGELEARLDGLVALAADRAPGAVELLGPAPRDERLQRVEAEAARVRSERPERPRAARVRDPGPRREGGGDLGHGAVGHAQEDEIGAGRLELAPRDVRGDPFRQARGHGGADASRADDTG
jgi:hypothetical protein